MTEANRTITGTTVLLTGASGGIGNALIEALIDAGAARIIAASRSPTQHGDARLHPLALDVRDPAAVQRAAAEFAPQVDILINNAGANTNTSVFRAATLDGARKEMEVNYFGTLHMVRAFAPAMRQRRRGVIVNMLSMVSYVNIPRMGTYCATKAAAWSLTQAIRAELAPDGVDVYGIFPSATDTTMSAHLTIPKLAPATVAAAVVNAIRDGIEDQCDGLIHEELYNALRTDPKSVERRMAATVSGSQ